MKMVVLVLSLTSSAAFASDYLKAKELIEIKPKTTETLVLSESNPYATTSSPGMTVECYLKHGESDRTRHITQDARFDILDASEPKRFEPTADDKLHLAQRFGYNGPTNLTEEQFSDLFAKMGIAKFFGVVRSTLKIESKKTKQIYEMACWSYNEFTSADLMQNMKDHGKFDWDYDSDL